jgi:hypothetical protein
MPNHVTHRVVVRGPAPDLSLFKDTFLPLQTATDQAGDPHSPERVFDFNALVPMPEIIRDTESSSTVNDGLVVLGMPKIPDLFGHATSLTEAITKYLAMPWVEAAGVTDYEALKRLLLERSPDCVEKAQTAMRAYEAYGHISWYSWSIEKWGTKWNAYDVRIVEHAQDHLVFCFDTAWSPPVPIFHALATREEVTNLTFEITAFDEGWGFAYVGAISNGHHLGEIVEATPDLYKVVYDRPADG